MVVSPVPKTISFRGPVLFTRRFVKEAMSVGAWAPTLRWAQNRGCSVRCLAARCSRESRQGELLKKPELER
jgi:hypothetical protein